MVIHCCIYTVAQLDRQFSDEETQLYADMTWADADIQKKHAGFMPEQHVRCILLFLLFACMEYFAAGTEAF